MPPLFRATVWTRPAAAVANGDFDYERQIIERRSRSRGYFESEVIDELARDVDDDISFGPVTEVDEEERERKRKRIPRGFQS